MKPAAMTVPDPPVVNPDFGVEFADVPLGVRSLPVLAPSRVPGDS